MSNTLLAASCFVVGTVLFLFGAIVNWLVAAGWLTP